MPLAGSLALATSTPQGCTFGKGGFYLHLDEAEADPYHYHCVKESAFCTPAFIQYLLNHPCRVHSLTPETPVVLVNVMHRALEQSVLEESFRYSLRVLRRLPAVVKQAKYLYVFAGGEMWLYAGYETAIPSQAVFFSQEPLFWRSEPLSLYVEREVPSEPEACYIYAPSQHVVVVPYTGSVDRGFDPASMNRPFRVAYYSALHGRAWPLRRRLYQLCESESKLALTSSGVAPYKPWLCWKTPLPGGQAPMFQRFQQSDFCFCPTGDGPLRTTVWQAFRRGCIPVLFSSCPQGALTEAYNPYFIPEDDGPPLFGLRRWAVLLNQTAVMLDEQYVSRMLSAIDEQQLLRVRRELRKYAERMSYFTNSTEQLEARRFLQNREPGLLTGDPLSFIVGTIVRKEGGAPMRSRASAVAGFAKTFVLDYVPRATNDGRTCATKACRHRAARGARGNYSDQFGEDSTTIDRPVRRPTERACRGCVFGSTNEPAASASHKFNRARLQAKAGAREGQIMHGTDRNGRRVAPSSGTQADQLWRRDKHGGGFLTVERQERLRSQHGLRSSKKKRGPSLRHKG